jgi:tryptophan halogenase
MSPAGDAERGLDAAVRRVTIVGGGTSGWMCAAALSRMATPDLSVTLVESPEVGTIGVGEATIPSLIEFNRFLGLGENEVLRACGGTFKYGIEFVDWRKGGGRYFHPFCAHGRDTPDFPFHQLWLRLRALAAAGEVPGDLPGDLDDYNSCSLAARLGRFAPPNPADAALPPTRHAYHLDASLYARLLRRYAEGRGVQRLEGLVVGVERDPASGLIGSLRLEDGRAIEGDLFIDCSGFRALLIGDAMDSGFVDWSHYLPCDRALALPTAANEPPAPCTRATADDAGWRWRIPLQHRTGNGYVYASAFVGDDDAHRRLMEAVDADPLAEARPLRFRTGHRQQFWAGNCVAIGLAGGFIEPLESTSIHLAQVGIQRLVTLWPGRGLNPAEVACYNRLMTADYQRLRDFIVLHYAATGRDDTDFWRHVGRMAVPDTLAEKIELFRFSGRIVPDADDLFTTHNWLAVMLGQGVEPATYDSLADRVPADALARNMRLLRDAVARSVAVLPTHQAYIEAHCAA